MNLLMHKIAVVIPKYGLLGGAEQFVAELTNRLAASFVHDFHVYANRWEKSAAPITFHRIPIISFPKYLASLSFAYFVNRRIKCNDAYVIHSHERIFAADIFTLHGIPHRYWVRHIRRKHMSLYDLATAWVEKKLVYEGHCKKFIAVSSLTKNIFLHEYNIDSKLVDVIHPGVDLHDYTKFDKIAVRNEIRCELGIESNEPVLLFASMNFEIKGLDDILLCLSKLKSQNRKFKLIVVGKGNIKKYKQIAQKAEISSNIIFTGPVSKEKMIKIYLSSDFYIMLSKFDTFGMVVLEAMAARLPVIISSNVGAKDLVLEGQNGFIINNTADSDYIAAKIDELCNENTRSLLAEAAYQAAAQNTWDHVVAKYQKIYTEILATSISNYN
jgi:UDP-glucose:(heptosyl)LPS alpha-1,3-glucosyltransferase